MLEVGALPADGEESMPVASKEVDQAAAILCAVVLEVVVLVVVVVVSVVVVGEVVE